MSTPAVPSTQQPSLPVRIRTGAKAFIVHNGKILVVHERLERANGAIEIMNDVPGGGIESDETLQQGLHREVFEEVGLTVEIVKPVGCWDFMINGEGEIVHIVCVAYQCRVVGEPESEPTIDVTNNPAEEDIYEAEWLTKEEILSRTVFENEDMNRSLQNVEI